MSDTRTLLRGICVGAGYFGRFHYEAWQRIPNVDIVAACDLDLDKARDAAETFGIPRAITPDDLEQVLAEEQPDFLDLITPPSTHLELCRIAVRAGVHIICQKPLAPTYAETLELAALVKHSPGRFMVHENWRWQPWYREIKRLLEDGAIGAPFQLLFQCRMGDGWGDNAYLDRQPFFRDYPRLFIFETGVHFLDTFRFLLGEPESIYAQIARRNPVIQGEDAAIVHCRFPGDVAAVLDANRYNETDSDNPRYTFGTLRLDGSQGHLELDYDGRLFIKPLGETKHEHLYRPPTGGFAGDCVHALACHFVECLTTGTGFESTIDDYLRTIRLVEACYTSAAQNQVVPIDEGEPNP